MFQTPEPLNPEHHQQLKLSSTPDYRFATKQMAVPVVSGEKWEISREYIMVFPASDEGLPMALLGMHKGTNVYVRDGIPPWWGRYVPAHFRRYPFVAATKPSEANKPLKERSFTVMVDTAAPHLSSVEGQPLFEEDGQPSKLLQEIQYVLANLQKDMDVTQKMVRELSNAGLLVDQAITLNSAQGEPVALKGFRVIDKSKLRELPSVTLSQLLQSGALDLAYAHIASLSNVRDGLLAKKAASEADKLSETDLEEFFNDDEDLTFNFDD